MAQVVDTSRSASATSLSVQLELEAASHAALRVLARKRPAVLPIETVDRRAGLRARKSFREATAILQAEMVR
jgi:hypothetical protein